MPPTRPRSQITVQSFGDISRFLRSGVADEESRQLRDSIGALAQQIDDAICVRRAASASSAAPDTPEITRQAARLELCVREHQLLVTGMGSAWHALYEMGAYQAALRNLRRTVDAWLQALRQRSAKEMQAFDAVERLAWRTLGEGVLLIDMYEQGENAHSEPPPQPQAVGTWQRAMQWLLRWRR